MYAGTVFLNILKILLVNRNRCFIMMVKATVTLEVAFETKQDVSNNFVFLCANHQKQFHGGLLSCLGLQHFL